MNRPSVNNFNVEFEYGEKSFKKKKDINELVGIPEGETPIVKELSYDVSASGSHIVRWKKVRRSDGKLHAFGSTIVEGVGDKYLPAHIRKCPKHADLLEI